MDTFAHAYDALIDAVHEDLASPALINRTDAHKRIVDLRNALEFDHLVDYAARLLFDWPEDALFHKLYAQALIDTSKTEAGIAVMTVALAKFGSEDSEYDDMRGLIGRGQKDLCVIALKRGRKERAAHYAERSFRTYMGPFEESGNTYHGVNALAVTAFAQDYGLTIPDAPDLIELVSRVMTGLASQPQDSPWTSATRAECHIALGDWDAAENDLGIYLNHKRATRFHIGGTLRQFRDLWRLSERGVRGRQILTALQTKALALAYRVGDEEFAGASVQTADVALDIPDAALEKMLGADGLRSFTWVKRGVKRARSVAAVVTAGGERYGTAFVIDPKVLGITWLADDELCMITNYHVLNREGQAPGLSLASKPTIRFEHEDGEDAPEHRVTAILHESPYYSDGLDFAIFTAQRNGLSVDPLPIEDEVFPDLSGSPLPRVYLIGHPLGGEMQFSLQDNRVLDHEGPTEGAPPVPGRIRLHYFAPTQQGNSGSPVFDSRWRCIALHHAGSKLDPMEGKSGMKKLNGKEGRYSANQGIHIGSIITAVKKSAGA